MYIYMYIRIMEEHFTMNASLKEISPFSLLPTTNSFKQRRRQTHLLICNFLYVYLVPLNELSKPSICQPYPIRLATLHN